MNNDQNLDEIIDFLSKTNDKKQLLIIFFDSITKSPLRYYKSINNNQLKSLPISNIILLLINEITGIRYIFNQKDEKIYLLSVLNGIYKAQLRRLILLLFMAIFNGKTTIKYSNKVRFSNEKLGESIQKINKALKRNSRFLDFRVPEPINSIIYNKQMKKDKLIIDTLISSIQPSINSNLLKLINKYRKSDEISSLERNSLIALLELTRDLNNNSKNDKIKKIRKFMKKFFIILVLCFFPSDQFNETIVNDEIILLMDDIKQKINKRIRNMDKFQSMLGFKLATISISDVVNVKEIIRIMPSRFRIISVKERNIFFNKLISIAYLVTENVEFMKSVNEVEIIKKRCGLNLFDDIYSIAMGYIRSIEKDVIPNSVDETIKEFQSKLMEVEKQYTLDPFNFDPNERMVNDRIFEIIELIDTPKN